MKTVMMTSFGAYRQTEQAAPIKASGGDVGGVRDVGHLLYQDTIGSLCATDYKWVQQEQVMQGKLIIETWK